MTYLKAPSGHLTPLIRRYTVPAAGTCTAYEGKALAQTATDERVDRLITSDAEKVDDLDMMWMRVYVSPDEIVMRAPGSGDPTESLIEDPKS